MNWPRISLRRSAIRLLGPHLRSNPRLRKFAGGLDTLRARVRHSAADHIPSLIRPETTRLWIAITSSCNSRCLGCRYGRDFMPGTQLPASTVFTILDDAKELGISSISFYGGEPLLHRELPAMISHAAQLGFSPGITTNGILLESRIDDLFAAGLSSVSLGCYGFGEEFDAYTQVPGGFSRVERGVARTRERYGDEATIYLYWLLKRPTCGMASLERLFEFGERYSLKISLNLVQPSFPYFCDSPSGDLQFRPEDLPQLEKVTAELVRMKQLRPDALEPSVAALRSIPDWAIKKSAMRVPCTHYRDAWIGSDGSVHQCQLAPRLGNINEQKLGQILYSELHEQSARDAFALNCPNCVSSFSQRIEYHGPSRRRYASP